MQNSSQLVAESLREAVLRSVNERMVPSLLYSGGVDSSVVAWILKREGRQVELDSISLPGETDASSAEESAKIMGMECHLHVVSRTEILEVARKLRSGSPELSLNDVAVQTSMHLAISKATSELVLTAQGADAMFLGYAHSKGLSGNVLALRAEDDLKKVVEKDLPSARAYASTLGKELVAPFLDPSFMRTLSTIPWEQRLDPRENKWLLRAAARELQLPEAIVHRPKKTFQYGSGIYTELKKSL